MPRCRKTWNWTGPGLRVDRQTMATSVPGVFASGIFLAGEIFTGPTLAVAAAASGRRAAGAIDHFLRTGRYLTVPDDCPRPSPEVSGKAGFQDLPRPQPPYQRAPGGGPAEGF